MGGPPMNQARLGQIRIAILQIMTGLVITVGLGAATARPQSRSPGPAPTSKLSRSERTRRLAERDRYRAEVIKLAQSGKLDEAAAEAVKELAVTREMLGEFHEDVVSSLDVLARLQEYRADWAAAG